MSSSQQPSNNSNNNNSNQFIDYEADHLFDNRGQSHGNDLFEQMYPFQDDADEDLPNELVAALDRKDPIQSNINDEDESVFSDVVQDAFKKYQNEIWDNRFSEDEQEELYAQMEECWNYMAQENTLPDPSKPSVGQSQLSQLNPDATEFKPSWLQSSTNGELSNTSITQEKKL